MTERTDAPRLADIIEAIERIRRVLDGVTLEAFEQNWEKRWLVEHGLKSFPKRRGHNIATRLQVHQRVAVIGIAGQRLDDELAALAVLEGAGHAHLDAEQP